MAEAGATASARPASAMRARPPALSLSVAARRDEGGGADACVAGRDRILASPARGPIPKFVGTGRTPDGCSSLPRSRLRIALLLVKKGLLDLAVDADEPSFGARGTVAKVGGLGFGVPQSLLGRAQLEGQLVRQIHGARAILLRHVRGLLQHCHDGAAGFIGCNFGLRLRCRRKRHDGTCCFVGWCIRTHRYSLQPHQGEESVAQPPPSTCGTFKPSAPNVASNRAKI